MVGKNFVSQDGLAVLHEGEAVVPKGYDPSSAASNEINKLADFISKNYPNEPGKTGENESAVDVAIRLLDS